MSIAIPKAERTGRVYVDDNGTLYEVMCPECQFPQFHATGVYNCIICDHRARVIGFEVVNGTGIAPGKESSNNNNSTPAQIPEKGVDE